MMQTYDNKKTYDKIAMLTILLLVVSLIPVVYLSFFDYATGDDLGYGASVYQCFVQGGNLWDALKSAAIVVRGTYDSWQGTWSSVFLFCFEPSVWGERWYILTPFIAMGFFGLGTFFFLKELLCGKLGLSKNAFAILFGVLSIYSIQYMPSFRGGMFWYTSVAHYVIPYGVALLSITFAMRYQETGKVASYVPLVIGMTYLGGAGYLALVLACFGVLVVILMGLLIVGKGSTKKRSLQLLLPLTLLLIGFIISAKAPGNAIRGGESFGLSGVAAIGAIVKSLGCCITDGVGYFITVRPLFLLVFLVPIVVFETFEPKEKEHPLTSMKATILGVVICFLSAACVYAPVVYAGVEVSGGVPVTEYFIFLLMLVVALAILSMHGKIVFCRRYQGEEYTTRMKKFATRVRIPFLVFTVLFCLVFAKYIVKNSMNYSCVEFARSGALSDFETQMQERLAILHSDEKNPVVPEMNDEQGPFMCMPLMQDKTNFVNEATARFYGKESVTAIPREKYERR